MRTAGGDAGSPCGALAGPAPAPSGRAGRGSAAASRRRSCSPGLGSWSWRIARPQAVVSVPRVEGTVILAFDVSGSMAADDLQPTRMEAAKAAARGFVERQPATC